MKKLTLLSLLLIFSSSLVSAQTSDGSSQEGRLGEASHRFNTATFTPAIPLSAFGGQGVSGAFAGIVRYPSFDNKKPFLVVAGGCNFPDTPAAEGGQKVFYTDIYVIGLEESTYFNVETLKAEWPADSPHKADSAPAWSRAGAFSCGLAYGASVTVPEGVVCLGGTADGQKSEDFAVLLSMGTSFEIQKQDIPLLPVALDNFAAAYGDGYIYVAGGQHNGIPNRKAFRLKWPLGAA